MKEKLLKILITEDDTETSVDVSSEGDPVSIRDIVFSLTNILAILTKESGQIDFDDIQDYVNDELLEAFSKRDMTRITSKFLN